MKRILPLIFLSAVLTASAQTPCVNGFAGEYPCDRIDLQSHMDMEAMGNAPGLNDIWGWTDSENGDEYALVGKTDGTAFVKITDPLNPILIGHLPSTNPGVNVWRDIKVFGDHAFIVSEQGGHGIQIFDLTRLRDDFGIPTEFAEDAHYSGFGNSHNIALNEESGYAYPIGNGEFSGGPSFINVQDPQNPVLEGGYSGMGYSHDAQIVNYIGPDTEHVGKEIYIGYHGNSIEGLVFVDVTDKTDPILLSNNGYDCQDYTHQGWLTPDQRYCFVSDEIDEGTFGYNTRTRIFNIEDLNAPFLRGSWYSDNTATDHNLYTKGDYAYMSNYASGLRIVDYSRLDDGIMQEVAYFDVHPSNNNVGYTGTWSNYPYFPSGNIVVTHRTDGLFIVKLQDLTGIIPTQEFDTLICPAEANFIAEYSSGIDRITPNPSTGLISIAVSSGTEVESIEVLDLSGRVLLKESISSFNNETIELDLTEFNAGIYLFRLNGVLSAERFVLTD